MEGHVSRDSEEAVASRDNDRLGQGNSSENAFES